jgi:hypothetical protein
MTDTIDDVQPMQQDRSRQSRLQHYKPQLWRLRWQAIARPTWPAPIPPVSSSRSGDALWNVFS